MSNYKIDVANTVIEIDTVHILPYALSRQFLTTKLPEFAIHSTQNDIDALKTIFETDNGLSTSWDGNIEVMVVLQKVADGLIDFGAFAIHGAAIAVEDSAYLFTANSGVGKTTHIMKWLANLEDCIVVNGDKPFILINDIPYVCGSPWAGKENLYSNTIVPLKAIILMERSEDNYIYQVSFMDAFPDLYKQIYRPQDMIKMKKTLALVNDLKSSVSFYRFKFNNYKDDCFDVAYQTLRDCLNQRKFSSDSNNRN